MKQYARTRYAPTPSGYLHLGNVLSFAITAAIAEREGAVIMLRIDDMDRERTEACYVRDIFETLDYMGLPWHEGPRSYEEFERSQSQVHRLPLYRAALQRLADNGKVFACTCSRSQLAATSLDGVYPGTCKDMHLPLKTPGAAWRLFTETYHEHQMPVHGYKSNVAYAAFPGDMQYFVVRKKDGFPAYQLTSLVDDVNYGVDLVVRGKDLWHSTLAQLCLAAALSLPTFAETTFVHHPLLVGDDERKLSKTAGDISIRYLRNEGRKPEEIYALIARMLGGGAATNYRELAALILMK